jgi:ribonuclease HII
MADTADFSLEDEIEGHVCGLDEVGRGPLAGGVVAACVYIPDDVRGMAFMAEVRDSKTLSWAKLERLYDEIMANCHCGVAEIKPAEIDEINILQASLKAMSHSYEAMDMRMAHALVDGNKMPALPCSATTIVKGDSKSKSIAAASIIAKVTRDRMMHRLAKAHPHYGWESNVGYPSKAHLAGIDAHGITEHHRKSFAPVRNFIESGSTRKP